MLEYLESFCWVISTVCFRAQGTAGLVNKGTIFTCAKSVLYSGCRLLISSYYYRYRMNI